MSDETAELFDDPVLIRNWRVMDLGAHTGLSPRSIHNVGGRNSPVSESYSVSVQMRYAVTGSIIVAIEHELESQGRLFDAD